MNIVEEYSIFHLLKIRKFIFMMLSKCNMIIFRLMIFLILNVFVNSYLKKNNCLSETIKRFSFSLVFVDEYEMMMREKVTSF
jgi:hypothetical protein